MKLISVYDNYTAPAVLYRLLQEREPHENISHRKMPSWDEHMAFVWTRPYAAWYLIDVDGAPVVATYLTRDREVGIGILKSQRRKGYAMEALQMLLSAHPGRLLANIAPGNERSLHLFGKLGFKGPIQVTMERA